MKTKLILPHEETPHEAARLLLRRSNCLRGKYACIIMQGNEVIGIGYNYSLTGCETCARGSAEHNVGDYSECRSIHAEQMALLNADRAYLSGARMYLVCDQDDDPKPCPICQRMMDWCGVELEREAKST